MRACFAAILTLWFAWNSLLGGIGELVLCLHADGATHVELAGKDTPVEEACCEHVQVSVTPIACPPCTDLILESVDLASIRPNGFDSAPPNMTAVATDVHLLPESVIRSGMAISVLPPTRGPPDAEPVCELIRRTSVWRI